MEDRPQCDKFSYKFIDEKRSSDELKEEQLLARARVKIRDVDSLSGSQEANIYNNEEESDQIFSVESQVTGVPVTSDLGVSQERIGRMKPSAEDNTAPTHLDLNSEAGILDKLPSSGISECSDNREKASILKKHERGCEHAQKCLASGCIGLDLNAKDASSSANQDPLDPHRIHGQLKSRDVSECESTTGPLEKKDSLRIWKEMKQNGFLSSSHGGFSFQSCFMSSSHGGTPVPEHCRRKTKNNILKRKMELAKREQVDRFTEVAAPSGLLNGLNPGIINHVRNKKQVHSIIEALVRKEELESSCVESKQASHAKCGIEKPSDVSGSGFCPVSFFGGNSSPVAVSDSKQKRGYASILDGNYSAVDRMSHRSFISHSTAVSEDDMSMLKLSSSKTSVEPSTRSNEELANMTNVSSLSVRAATVASQWLELLHQDIKGRLSALRCSKKRVQAVISTDLPFLVPKEFSHQEKDSIIMQNSSDGLSSNTNVAMHQARWSTLFSQMDKALIEEEKQLESWLNQVKEMQLHCDQGLQHPHWNAIFGHQQQGRSEIYARSGKADGSERELAVMAAAASIYSTCNFLMSKENISCF